MGLRGHGQQAGWCLRRARSRRDRRRAGLAAAGLCGTAEQASESLLGPADAIPRLLAKGRLQRWTRYCGSLIWGATCSTKIACPQHKDPAWSTAGWSLLPHRCSSSMRYTAAMSTR